MLNVLGAGDGGAGMGVGVEMRAGMGVEVAGVAVGAWSSGTNVWPEVLLSMASALQNQRRFLILVVETRAPGSEPHMVWLPWTCSPGSLELPTKFPRANLLKSEV